MSVRVRSLRWFIHRSSKYVLILRLHRSRRKGPFVVSTEDTVVIGRPPMKPRMVEAFDSLLHAAVLRRFFEARPFIAKSDIIGIILDVRPCENCLQLHRLQLDCALCSCFKIPEIPECLVNSMPQLKARC